MKLLVRATNWLGDAVMALPALRALRTRYPEARITMVARPWVAGLYQGESCADDILVPEGARALRRRRFDMAILLPNSFASAFAVWLAGIPRRIGYNRDGRGFLLTDPVAPPEPGRHETFYYLELLLRAGLIERLPAQAPVLLEAAGAARYAGLELFRAMGLNGPIVGVSPGAQNSRAKQWPPERFATAALRVTEAVGGSVALFGSAHERPLALGIAETLRRAGCPVLNLAGETTLPRFVELAAACHVFLTNDSGAMHVASALAVPTVAVFGPTEWVATAPAGPNARIVREPVECSPCMLRDCPTDHRCMTRVTAERVASEALELLK